MKNKYSTLETMLDIIAAIGIVIGICSNFFIAICSVSSIIFGIVCKRIGTEKGLDYGYIVGWFLGIIGLIIMLIISGEKEDNISVNKYDNLKKIQELKEKGIITEEEFEKEKDKLLN